MAWLATLVGRRAIAEEPLGVARDAPEPALQTQLVKTGLYLITGGGGNSLLRLSQAGCVLVGGKSPGSFRALMSQLRRINKLSDLPLRVLILPNGDPSQAGNQALFAADGVAVIAQRHLKLQDVPTARVVAFDRSYELLIGGVRMSLLNFGPARGNADTVVLFPDLKVLAVGDLYTNDVPQPDAAAGGSMAAWSGVIAELLRLDFDTVVAAAGPLIGRAQLEAFKERLDALGTQAR